MGKLRIFTTRLAALLVLHAAGVGHASPTVLVTRPLTRSVEWLPTDNQTVYKLGEGESRSLELNTSSISQTTVYITISPCTKDFHWALYHGNNAVNGHLNLLKENGNGEMSTFFLAISQFDRYVLKLASKTGGACVVSARGEPTRQVRLRLRVRSRRRLATNWDPSPIDPQATSYCVVASYRKNYSSLCAAQYDIKINRLDKANHLNVETDSSKVKTDRSNNTSKSSEIDNKIDSEDIFNAYDGYYNNLYRRKKFGRSTKVTTNEDPVIACVGERTHHLIENLDSSRKYYVSVFGVSKDRRSGSLLATGHVRPRTSTAKRLRENMPYKADVKGKSVYYFKATVGAGGGLWVTLLTCGGSVDAEVLVRGKRLFHVKNIEPFTKFFVAAPSFTSSIQETSDEGSIQFDSSSEETRVRYVIKVTPGRWDRDATVNVEVTVSTTRWGINTPEVMGDEAIVRELRPRRSCKSVDIAFLPATHNATDVIRYCTNAREVTGDNISCLQSKKVASRTQCTNQSQKPSARVIVQKIAGLKAGRKYMIQVKAMSKGSSVPYNALYVETNATCKDD